MELGWLYWLWDGLDGVWCCVWLCIPFWNWGYVVFYQDDFAAATFNVYVK